MLRGESPEWLCAHASSDTVCRAADAEGVLALLAERLTSSRSEPGSVTEAVRRQVRVLAVADLVREAELRHLLPAFERAGVRALLFKGAALAYTHYERPDLRQRLDTDILIAPRDRTAGDAVLGAQGYAPVQQFTGDLVAYQKPYLKRCQGAVEHVVDLHWRVANPQEFGQVFTVDELLAEAQPILGLGPAVLGPDAVHALLLGCIHRVAHHAGSPRLIWLYDIHLLSVRLARSDWERFTLLAIDREVAAICLDALRAAGRAFGTTIPKDVIEQLVSAGAGGDRTAHYLLPGRRHVQTVASDFWAMPTWRDRIRLVHQHALPPKRYMREVYAPGSGTFLPVLYVRRAVRGVRRWLSRS